MSVINLIFGSGARNAQIGGLTVDVTLSELHERNSDITESPVETGSIVTDHVVRRPARVRIEGFVTDTPAVIFGLGQGNRVQSAVETLEQLWKDRQVVQVVTGYGLYQNMVISELQLPRGREQALRFTASLQQIEVVESELAAIELVEGDAQDSASARNESGRQTTQPASEATGARVSTLESILRRIGRALERR